MSTPKDKLPKKPLAENKDKGIELTEEEQAALESELKLSEEVDSDVDLDEDDKEFIRGVDKTISDEEEARKKALKASAQKPLPMRRRESSADSEPDLDLPLRGPLNLNFPMNDDDPDENEPLLRGEGEEKEEEEEAQQTPTTNTPWYRGIQNAFRTFRGKNTVEEEADIKRRAALLAVNPDEDDEEEEKNIPPVNVQLAQHQPPQPLGAVNPPNPQPQPPLQPLGAANPLPPQPLGAVNNLAQPPGPLPQPAPVIQPPGAAPQALPAATPEPTWWQSSYKKEKTAANLYDGARSENLLIPFSFSVRSVLYMFLIAAIAIALVMIPGINLLAVIGIAGWGLGSIAGISGAVAANFVLLYFATPLLRIVVLPVVGITLGALSAGLALGSFLLSLPFKLFDRIRGNEGANQNRFNKALTAITNFFMGGVRLAKLLIVGTDRQLKADTLTRKRLTKYDLADRAEAYLKKEEADYNTFSNDFKQEFADATVPVGNYQARFHERLHERITSGKNELATMKNDPSNGGLSRFTYTSAETLERDIRGKHFEYQKDKLEFLKKIADGPPDLKGAAEIQLIANIDSSIKGVEEWVKKQAENNFTVKGGRDPLQKIDNELNDLAMNLKVKKQFAPPPQPVPPQPPQPPVQPQPIAPAGGIQIGGQPQPQAQAQQQPPAQPQGQAQPVPVALVPRARPAPTLKPLAHAPPGPPPKLPPRRSTQPPLVTPPPSSSTSASRKNKQFVKMPPIDTTPRTSMDEKQPSPTASSSGSGSASPASNPSSEPSSPTSISQPGASDSLPSNSAGITIHSNPSPNPGLNRPPHAAGIQLAVNRPPDSSSALPTTAKGKTVGSTTPDTTDSHEIKTPSGRGPGKTSS